MIVLVALKPFSETEGPDSGLSSKRMPPIRKRGRFLAKDWGMETEESMNRSVVRLSRRSFYASLTPQRRTLCLG